jgi:hypothetical protein
MGKYQHSYWYKDSISDNVYSRCNNIAIIFHSYTKKKTLTAI